MPDENLEIVKQAFGAFNRRDVEAFVALTAPDVEWFPVMPTRDGIRVYRGHAGVREYMAGIAADYMQAVAIPHDLRSAVGGRVLVLCRIVHVAREADVDTQLANAGVYQLRDRMITRIQGFVDAADAMASVEVS